MKIAVVTGASSGIGREFALQISRKFRTLDEIWIIARREDRLIELSSLIDSPYIRVIPADITLDEGLDVYKNLLDKYNPQIRILINAAGSGLIGRFEDISDEDAYKMIDLNCKSLTRMTNISLPYMEEKISNIINIASAAAFLPQPSFAVYAASKSYVLSLSRALNKELKGRGITVTAVCPGPVDTEFFDKAEKYDSVKTYKKMFKAKCSKVVKFALIDAYHGMPVSVYGVTMKLLRIVTKIVPTDFAMKFID